jgi:UDP-N-acetylglucosamine acyltransferase
LHIGDDTVIHENATLHRGTKETGKTVIGSNALLMAYSHVAHDCRVGDRVILANAVQIAGHVHIGDWTIVGGVTAVHQFTHIGQHSMIGGGLRGIGQDVPPYIIVASEPVKFAGLNVIGLRRRGFTNEQITVLKGIYDILYDKKYNVSQAKEKIREDYRDDPYAVEIIGFIENSKRGISGK